MPSKFHRFDYYVFFNDQEEILKVEGLHYRENYGGYFSKSLLELIRKTI